MDLWHDLIDFSIDKPYFVHVLLHNIGTHVDPRILIERIEAGREIPGLRDSLVQIMHDYQLQVIFLLHVKSDFLFVCLAFCQNVNSEFFLLLWKYNFCHIWILFFNSDFFTLEIKFCNIRNSFLFYIWNQIFFLYIWNQIFIWFFYHVKSVLFFLFFTFKKNQIFFVSCEIRWFFILWNFPIYEYFKAISSWFMHSHNIVIVLLGDLTRRL